MRKALLVGINHYLHSPLRGCIEDVDSMYNVLSRNDDNSVNFSCKRLISKDGATDTVTITKLKKQILNLLQHEAEVAILYFSGHGATNTVGTYLVTQDAKKYHPGVSLSEIITIANSSKVREVIIILDCCFSGDMGNLNILGDGKALLREGVSILTSSRSAQLSWEIQTPSGVRGLFTSIIHKALQGGAADILGKVNVASVYNYVDQLLDSWEQRPIFKSHVSKMVTLRKCQPKIGEKELRKLTTYFKRKTDLYQLDPSYSETIPKKKNKENILIMKDLREYYSLGLLVPIGEKYMYYAAKNSKSCELTMLGQYYWSMVEKDKL